jgi:hypothetical protein
MHYAMNCSLHNSLHNSRITSFVMVLKVSYSVREEKICSLENNKKWIFGWDMPLSEN